MKVYIVYNWAVDSIDAVFSKRERAEEFMLEGINQITCRIEEHDVRDTPDGLDGRKEGARTQMKIKQLEWKQEDGIDVAYGFFGCFEVWPNDDKEGTLSASMNDSNNYDGFEEKDDCASLEEAKAYCQSLFEKQVNGALEFVEPDNKFTWRRADNPPLLEGQYLVKKMNKYGAVQHSVNLYYPGFGWVMIKDGFSVVEWMQIPGSEE